MVWRLRSLALLVLFAVFGLGLAQAQPAIQPNVDITKVPAAAQPSAHFNADAATEAYMAMIPSEGHGPLECLLRRRLLADSLGLSVWLGRCPSASEPALVGKDA